MTGIKGVARFDKSRKNRWGYHLIFVAGLAGLILGMLFPMRIVQTAFHLASSFVGDFFSVVFH